jgi:pyruvate formate lyase activating enzyme
MMIKNPTQILDRYTVTGELYETLPGGDIRCTACGHRCLIRDGKRGICKVRFNSGGLLKVPWGYVSSLQSDPIEKKPFFHVLPGEDALTFGMLGCDFHCSYCQNWQISQVGRNSESNFTAGYIHTVTPELLVEAALHSEARVVASSYNEPLITSEWSASIFEKALEAGLKCAYISNGNATPEALAYLRPYLTAYKVDLKTMQDRSYRKLGGVLQNVLDTIKMAHELGLWVEVVTLIVPGFNDSSEELMEAARYIASVSVDIPWHVTAFHPDYKMVDPPQTSLRTLVRAAEIGQEAGLNYVYAGNIPGRVGGYEDTNCPSCQRSLIVRRGFTLLEYHLTGEGTCPDCSARIPGVWSSNPNRVSTGGDFRFPKRSPLR